MVDEIAFDLGPKAIRVLFLAGCSLQKLLDRIQMSEMRQVEIPQQI